jgi:heme iron utilization protein
MDKFSAAIASYNELLTTCQSLMLATAGADGLPNASYAPFVMDADRNFYIYVSGLSAHTQHLETTGRGAVLLIEDEAAARQIFARRRLSYDCTARLIPREDAGWGAIVDQFADRFGPVVEMFRELDDFRIIQLQPVAGRFVMGFGAAYRVDPQDLTMLVQITGK